MALSWLGGVISPLLANIALHGMQEALGIKHRNRGELDSPPALVRYADDYRVSSENSWWHAVIRRHLPIEE
jgi:RNA-directed DNA polymerase